MLQDGGVAAVVGIKERYVFYVAPLLALGFALYASRGWPLRIAHLAITAALVVVSVRVPLSSFTAPQAINASPILYAVVWLGRRLGAMGDAATAVAAAVAVMSGVAVVASRRPRLATPVVLGLALLATGAASAGAVALVVSTTRTERNAVLPSDPSWIDHARVGRTVLLQSAGGSRMASLQELFWNRSVDRVMLLPGALPIDAFNTQSVKVTGDGSLLSGGRPVTTPLLVDEYGSTVRLRDAKLVRSGPSAALWVPAGRPKLSLYAAGRYYDGWLAGSGEIRLWPEKPGERLSGWLSMRLTAPRDSDATTLTFRPPGTTPTLVRLRPGTTRRVKLAVCGAGVAEINYRASAYRLVGLRIVSVKSTEPVFTPNPSACPSADRSAPGTAHSCHFDDFPSDNGKSCR